jgi:hypothetical protein
VLDTNRRHFDLNKVNEVWDEYARTHDLTGQDHKVVGIDPDSREVFVGDSLREVIERLKHEGRFRPLYYRRVGSPYLYRKSGRR